MIHSIVFSPTGTSGKVADILVRHIGSDYTVHDITVKAQSRIVIDDDADIAVFAVPVYAGRIPALAAGRLQAVSGSGQKAVAIVVYGNRDYDDALAELCDIVAGRGFRLVAAGAFIARHCIFPKVATGRPDASDEERIAEFASLIRQNCDSGRMLDIASVKGNRPYKEAKSVPQHPEVDKAKCNGCGACAAQCPAGAIDAASPQKTDASRCITCCRCIYICPHQARHFGGMLYKLAGWKFTKDNSRRLEPEWFI